MVTLKLNTGREYFIKGNYNVIASVLNENKMKYLPFIEVSVISGEDLGIKYFHAESIETISESSKIPPQQMFES